MPNDSERLDFLGQWLQCRDLRATIDRRMVGATTAAAASTATRAKGARTAAAGHTAARRTRSPTRKAASTA